MTATWSDTKANGSGRLRYRLQIEGWPEEWVTDKSITHATNAAGRTVRVGLDMTNVQIHDRSVMYEGSCQSDGIAFKIRPEFWQQTAATSWGDPATSSFSARIEQTGGMLAFASTAITSTAMTMPTCLPGTLANDSYYHMNTETVYVTTWPNISARAQWGTTAQAHTISTANDTDLPGYWICDAPFTMEGRRATLYVYGDSDVGAGDGHAIWRGIVRRPPSLDRDGVSWVIRCDGVTAVLKQNLAGTAMAASPTGIYHHADCGIRISIRGCDHVDIIGFGGATAAVAAIESLEQTTLLVGWHATEQEVFDAINSQLATYLPAANINNWCDYIKIQRDARGKIVLALKTNANDIGMVRLSIASPILGTFYQGGWAVWSRQDRNLSKWVEDGTGIIKTGYGNSRFRNSRVYTAELYHPMWDLPYDYLPWPAEEEMSVCSPLGPVARCMGVGNFGKKFGNIYVSEDAAERADNPPWRIYVDKDLSAADAVYIEDTEVHEQYRLTNKFFTIAATGDEATRGYYIDIDPPTLPVLPLAPVPTGPGAAAVREGFLGFLGPESEILQQRLYAQDGTILDFMEELTQHEAIDHANDGDVPFITLADLTDWEALYAIASDKWGLIARRRYAFYRPVSFEEFILEELKLIGWFMRIASDGRIDIAPLPSLTDTYPVPTTHRLTRADIVAPADDYGDWPGWEPQRDGRISVVTIQNSYNPTKDEWADPPVIGRDLMSIAATKLRGRSEVSIKPYSVATQAQVFADRREILERIAHRFLNLFAKDYDVIRLAVPFTKFDVLVGNVVTVTYDLIPSGVGGRGLSARRGIVIERTWDMDPSGAGHGWLTIMLAPPRLVGYAPSGVVTGQVNTAGNSWALTLSIANAYNVSWSTLADGKVLEHFASGDYIRLVQWDATSPTVVTGLISGNPAVSAGTCTVDLDSPWTPGTDTWVLEFQNDTAGVTATAAQRAYAYVADNDLGLNDGTIARKFG